MVLSEADAEARLSALRRQRAGIEREIEELTLYLTLGRRLSGAPEAAPAGTGAAADLPARPAPDAEPMRRAADTLSEATEALRAALRARAAAPSEDAVPPQAEAGPAPSPSSPTPAWPVSEATKARRYGRALIDAAIRVLEEAGRPLHAGEILVGITAQGFALPGADPIAALNTRLWKRSGPDGPLRRLGEAVYALAEEEAEPI